METSLSEPSRSLVDPFIFNLTVDRRSLDDLFCILSLSKSYETRAERKQRLSKEKSNRFVTKPGTEVQMSKDHQLVHMIVLEVLRDGRTDGTTLKRELTSPSSRITITTTQHHYLRH